MATPGKSRRPKKIFMIPQELSEKEVKDSLQIAINEITEGQINNANINLMRNLLNKVDKNSPIFQTDFVKIIGEFLLTYKKIRPPETFENSAALFMDLINIKKQHLFNSIGYLSPVITYIRMLLDSGKLNGPFKTLLFGLQQCCTHNVVAECDEVKPLISDLFFMSLDDSIGREERHLAETFAFHTFLYYNNRDIFLTQLLKKIEENNNFMTIVGENKSVMRITSTLVELTQIGLTGTYDRNVKKKDTDYQNITNFFNEFFYAVIKKVLEKKQAYEIFFDNLVDDLYRLCPSEFEYAGTSLMLLLLENKAISLFFKNHSPGLFLKHLKKIAVAKTRYDLIYEPMIDDMEKEFRKTVHGFKKKPYITVQRVFLNHLQSCTVNDEYPNISSAYEVLWKNLGQSVSNIDKATTSFPPNRKNLIKMYFYLIRNCEHYINRGYFLKLFLTAINGSSSYIKREAAQCISALICVNPAFFYSKYVQLAMRQSLELGYASVTSTFAKVVSKYLINQPSEVNTLDIELKMFLKDGGVAGRKTIIETLEQIFSNRDSISSPSIDLNLGVLGLINDLNESLKERVILYASRVCLRRDRDAPTLIDLFSRIPRKDLHTILDSIIVRRKTNGNENNLDKLTTSQLTNIICYIQSQFLSANVEKQMLYVNLLQVVLSKMESDKLQNYMLSMLILIERKDINVSVRKMLGDAVLANATSDTLEKSSKLILHLLKTFPLTEQQLFTTIINIARKLPLGYFENLMQDNLLCIQNFLQGNETNEETIKRVLWITIGIHGYIKYVLGIYCINKMLTMPNYQTTVIDVVGFSKRHFLYEKRYLLVEKLVETYLKDTSLGMNKEETSKSYTALVYLMNSIFGYKENLLLTKSSNQISQIGNTSTELLSELCQMLLPSIKDYCLLSSNITVRKAVAVIIKELVELGIIVPSVLLPLIFAMLCDNEPSIQQTVKNVLTSLPRDTDITSFVIEGFKIAFNERKNKGQTVRGFNSDFLPSANIIFEVIGTYQSKFRVLVTFFLKTILNSGNEFLALYLSDNLALLQYKKRDQVLYIAKELTAITSLTDIGIDANSKEHLYARYLLTHLRRYFENIYHVTHNAVMSYNPSIPSKEPVRRKRCATSDWFAECILPSELKTEATLQNIISFLDFDLNCESEGKSSSSTL